MVTGLITGPNRIPDLKIIEAMQRPGVFEFHFPEEAQRRILEFEKAEPPVIYYPSTLATYRREGKLFSVTQTLAGLEAAEKTRAEAEKQAAENALKPSVHPEQMGLNLSNMPEVTLTLIPESSVLEALAA